MRALHALVHVLFSLVGWAWFMLTRRRGVVAFTHFQDLDRNGRDCQMGPLVDALRRTDRLVEITFVPLRSGLWRNLRSKRRLFLSHVLVRTLGAKLVLRTLRPKTVYLIDESGSGQPLLKAARALGIRVVGVQHGDFRTGDKAYDLAADSDVEPADTLCTWSPWFLERLYAISPIYGPHNTCVTGRLRHKDEPTPAAAVTERAAMRVLVLGEAGQGFRGEIQPYLTRLEAAPDLILRIRKHPSIAPGSTPLAADLLEADVVVGIRSSAVLESLYHHRPAVIVGAKGGLMSEGLATGCTDPDEIVAACRRAISSAAAAAARLKVWGDSSEDPVRAVLAAGQPDG